MDVLCGLRFWIWICWSFANYVCIVNRRYWSSRLTERRITTNILKKLVYEITVGLKSQRYALVRIPGGMINHLSTNLVASA